MTVLPIAGDYIPTLSISVGVHVMPCASRGFMRGSVSSAHVMPFTDLQVVSWLLQRVRQLWLFLLVAIFPSRLVMSLASLFTFRCYQDSGVNRDQHRSMIGRFDNYDATGQGGTRLPSPGGSL